MSVVYAEDNPLWVLVYFLLTVALLAVVAVLGAFYLAGLYFARRLDRWVEGARAPLEGPMKRNIFTSVVVLVAAALALAGCGGGGGNTSGGGGSTSGGGGSTSGGGGSTSGGGGNTPRNSSPTGSIVSGGKTVSLGELEDGLPVDIMLKYQNQKRHIAVKHMKCMRTGDQGALCLAGYCNFDDGTTGQLTVTVTSDGYLVDQRRLGTFDGSTSGCGQ